jgi:hypothetical protein
MHVLRAAAIAAIPLLSLCIPGPAKAAPLDSGSWLVVPVAAPRLAAARQAPADEYFGPERLSNLGVRNAIRDMDLEGTSPLALPMQRSRMAAVEDALAIWADRYPSDTWLPGTILDYAKFLQSKQQAFTDDLALGYLMFLEVRYPASRPGFEAREMLASYRPLPAFDMSDAGAFDPQPSVGASLYPKVRR